MQKYQNNVVNTAGVAVGSATVTVTNYPAGTAATIYSDNGVTLAANPLTTDAKGQFSFYAADGRYSVSISGSGITTNSITDILLEDPANGNAVVVVGGSVDNSPIGATTPSTGKFTTLQATSINSTPIGVTTPSTGAFTTLSASGGVTVNTASSGGLVFDSTSTGTTGNFGRVVNFGGGLVYGVEPSVGGNYITGSTAYDAVLRGKTGIAFSANDGAGMQMRLASTGLSVTGALSATGGVSAGGTSNFVGGIFNNNNAGNQLIQTSTNNYATGLGIWAGGAPIVVSSAGFTFRTGATLSAGVPAGGSDVMTLDTSGNLGLGVTPSAWIGFGKSLEMNAAGNYVGGNNTGSYLSANVYYASGWRYARTGFAVQYTVEGATGQHQWFTAPSGTAGNPITFTQSLSLGKGTALTLEGGTSTAGTGIAFPATQLASTDPNTLDDYREGTWTPIVGGSATYTAQQGTYTKIGRQVTVWFDLTINAIGTGSTNLISGLPFTNNAQQCAGNLSYWNTSATAIVSASIVVNPSATTIQIYSNTAAASTVNGGIAIFGNGTRVIGSATYFV